MSTVIETEARQEGIPSAPAGVAVSESLYRFVRELRFSDLPADVVAGAQRCLLDLLGVAAGGTTTDLSRIIRDHAASQFATHGRGARMLFDGRRVSETGAALAGGMTIDSLDAHDGHVLTKGHVGVAVLPALLAYVDAGSEVSGPEFLTNIVIGYEIATRAGIALHGTACDYHTSGAWNALACTSIGVRLHGLDHGQLREGLGIAEYHGPRSQMMRCIDFPTMVKDGSGWGAMVGVSAAHLAAAGFTGAPALTIESYEVADTWGDLGQRWRTLEQYFKPYPVCRWAQPPVEAALELQRAHGVAAADIEKIEVASFHEAIRLATRQPPSTEAAQYSLPFSVASALVRGRLGAAEVAAEALTNPETLRLSTSVVLSETAEYNDRFPAERWAHVSFHLRDGTVLRSEPAIARGNPENALSANEMTDKYHTLARPILGDERTDRIEKAVAGLIDESADMPAFLDAVLEGV